MNTPNPQSVVILKGCGTKDAEAVKNLIQKEGWYASEDERLFEFRGEQYMKGSMCTLFDHHIPLLFFKSGKPLIQGQGVPNLVKYLNQKDYPELYL